MAVNKVAQREIIEVPYQLPDGEIRHISLVYQLLVRLLCRISSIRLGTTSIAFVMRRMGYLA